MGSLEGMVAAITGAANGIGRAHALYLARQGVQVVVNDLGVDRDGHTPNHDPAQAVVEEIKAAGGNAVAHFGDCADWNASQDMIKTAVDTFGDLHILVNNAGFLRDKMIFSMSEEDFDAVVRVHLKGHFCGIRHALGYWREQSKAKGEPVYGRILSTASESALFQEPGQPNYSAAKAGIIALTGGAAQAGLKYGVTANTIMPRARTRMVAVGPWASMFDAPEEGFDNFNPENVSPLVAYLASPEAAHISGNLFIAWGPSITVVQRPGLDVAYHSETGWTLESVADTLGKHFDGAEPVKDSYVTPSA